MRSRFTAHVVGDHAHLERTWLRPARTPEVDASESDASEGDGRTWTRLVVHSHARGSRPNTASVDFTAYYLEGGRERAFREHSAFERVDGAWYYTRPLHLEPQSLTPGSAKVGRNAPCPCGSGKKFKRCCG